MSTKQSPQLRHYYRKREELISLLGGKCVDCGVTHDLQFDHADASSKSFDISNWYGLSMEKLKPELDKCVLRCKPCHGVKTREVDGLKMEHGKFSMYRHGKCRCDLCKEANRVQWAAWDAKRRGK